MDKRNQPEQFEQDSYLEDPDRASGKNSRETTVRSEIYDWLRCIVTAIVACVIIFVFFARIVGVVGSSMVPTLHEGDRIITSNLFYTPKQGDIVVLRKQSFDERAIVKRVIATEGQTVDIDFEAGIVYVDGEALTEDYVNAPIHDRIHFEGEVTVPEGCVFVLGDNRNASSDSRHAKLGCVDERYILGKAYLILLPFKDFGFLG